MMDLFYAILSMFLAIFGWGFYQFKRAEKAEQEASERKVDEIINKAKVEIAPLDPDGRAAFGNDLLRKYRENRNNQKK